MSNIHQSQTLTQQKSFPAIHSDKNGGEVIPFDRSANEEKEEYVNAIRMWCCNRNLEDALTPQEIGAMRAFDRIDAQRKFIIDALSQYYRAHPRADVAPGVAVVVALLSDNAEGMAKVSQPSLATFFGRSRSAIGDAQKRLRDANLIGTTRGRYAGNYPIIARSFTQKYNHIVWLVEAINTQDGALKLPAPPADCQSTGPTGGLSQSTGPVGALKTVNQPVEPVSINRPDATQYHYKNSTILDKATKVAALGIATAMSGLPAAAVPKEPVAISQPVKFSLDEMTDRMMDAAGRALANPAGAMGLLSMSEQQRWLAGGCDLEMDILPTIRAVASKQAPGSIKTWKYFTDAIAKARADRLAPLPQAEGKKQKPSSDYSYSGAYVGPML
jgi:hypothetical protein